MWTPGCAARSGKGIVERSWLPGTTTTGTPASDQIGGERAEHEIRLHAAAIEDVPSVHDEIDLPAKRRQERALEAREVLDRREPEVGVAEEEETEVR